MLVHCLAGANHEDLNRPFVETGDLPEALEISAFLLVAICKVPHRVDDGRSIMTLTYLKAPRVVKTNVMGVAKAALG